MEKVTVTCSCGAVSLAVAEVVDDLFVCHCETCQKWTGGMFVGTFVGKNVEIQGESNINYYASSEHAVRANCKKCGSPLFMRGNQEESYSLPAGLFPQKQFSEIGNEYFLKSKPDYYCLDSGGNKFDTY